MIRVVIDTMIFVRALINPYGFNARLLNRVDEYELSLSEEIIEEVVEVLFRPEIQKKYNPSKVITVHDVLEIISDADLITPSQKINLCRDPKDNKFIECAVEAEADYLCHDFEELMSLRVEQNVTCEEVNTLRFRFLDAFATDREEHPIAELARPWLGEFQQDWDDLLGTEEQFDRIRDEISGLRRQQEEIVQEAEQREQGGWRWRRGDPPRMPGDLQERWNGISERLRYLEEGDNIGLRRLRSRLEEATERLLPRLRERGVRFAVIEVEGVLGEYNFYERKVTLYPPMIELAAADLAPALQRPPNEVYDELYTIVEMHETAHATTHLGIDSNGTLWERPERGSSELHETLAQFYTFHLIRRLGEGLLEQVFLGLNEQQPERYRFWRCLQDVPLEMAREFLIGKRVGWFQQDLLSLAARAAEIVGSAMPLLRTVLPDPEFRAFTGGMRSIEGRLKTARTRRELGEAAEEFLAHCECHPFVRSLLQAALPHGLHSLAYRKLLLASMLTDGEPVRPPALRLTMDQIRAGHTAALMQNELVRQNEIVHELRVASELRDFASPNEFIRALHSYLPDDREEAVQIVELLLKSLRQPW